MTDRNQPQAMRPRRDAALTVREDAEFLAEFREHAELIGFTPADAVREALRNWLTRSQAIFNSHLLLVFVLLLLPAFASAQDFGVPASDASKRLFLDYMFPSDGGGPIVTALKVFNSAVLLVGGILTAYTLVAGTLATAHDGEMLGKKWSSIWIPIRTTLGAAALAPVIGGGMCAAQMIVIWLATFGIGIADQAWSAFASNPTAGASYASPALSQQWKTVAGQMFMLEVCHQALDAERQREIQGGGGLLAGPASQRVTLDNSDVWGFAYLHAQGACGSVALLKPQPADANAGGDVGASGVSRSLLQVQQLRTALLPAHEAATTAMDASMASLAQRFLAGGVTAGDVNAALSQASDAYAKTINQAATSATAGATNSDFAQALQQDGWAYAGAWYLKIAKAQDEVSGAVSASPQVSVRRTADFDDIDPQVLGQIKAAQALLTGAQAGGLQAVGAPSSDDMMAKVLSWFLDQTKGVNPVGNSENPVIAAKEFGNDLISWAWGSLGVGVAATAGGGIAAGNIGGKLLGADTALLATVSLLTLPIFGLFGTLMTAGVGLAVLVPMLPFILWLGVLFGWMLLVVEAVIGAPLWAVAHLAPDADGVVGRGGQGYMLILSLTLRPVLMILGFACAVTMMKPVGDLLNTTFVAVFNTSVLQDNASWGKLTITIAGYLLYSGLMVWLVGKVFALIHIVPDSVLRWIGGGAGNELGEHAQSAEGMSRGAVAATGAAWASAGQLGNRTGEGMANLAKGLAGRREQEQAEGAQAAGTLRAARLAAIDAAQRVETAPESEAAQERLAIRSTEAAQSALAMAAHHDRGFGKALDEAREQDRTTGGTAAVDALVKSTAQAVDAAEAAGQPITDGQRYAREAARHLDASRMASSQVVSIRDARQRYDATQATPPADGLEDGGHDDAP